MQGELLQDCAEELLRAGVGTEPQWEAQWGLVIHLVLCTCDFQEVIYCYKLELFSVTVRALCRGTNIAILALLIPHVRALIPPSTALHNGDL